MNAPEAYELFVLPPDVKKVSFKKDGKIQNAAAFVIEKEDHTLGNLIRMQLLNDPNVIFAGYRMPHPLDHKIVIKIQTNKNSTPTTTLTTAINNLKDEFSLLEERFKDALASKRNPDAPYIYN